MSHHTSSFAARYPLTPGLSLRVPVVQAPLSTSDGPALAAAVSRAGGLGTLTVLHPEPADFARALRQIRRRTMRPVLLAFNAEWESPELLDTALALGFRHFHLFWWNAPRLTRRIHRAGGEVFWQIGTPDQADDALRGGADALILQGTAAGGPVRSPYSLRRLTEETLLLRGDAATPLIAGGGLADRTDVAEVLRWGASAALLGTRFLLTDESAAPRRDKQRLLDALNSDLFLDPAVIGRWPCAPRRRLNHASADRESLFAGLGLDRMATLLPASEVVRRLRPR